MDTTKARCFVLCSKLRLYSYKLIALQHYTSLPEHGADASGRNGPLYYIIKQWNTFQIIAVEPVEININNDIERFIFINVVFVQ